MAKAARTQVGFRGITRNGRPVPVKQGNFPMGKPLPGTVAQMAKRVGARVSKPGRPGTRGAQPPGARGGSSTTTTTTTPAAAVAPFLTPAQIAALSNWNTKYGTSLANLTEADANALSKFTQTYGADKLRNAQNVDMTNQNMGARGMFSSSIRGTALNDLAATLAQQYNILHTNYQSTLLRDASARGQLQGQDATTQLFYNQMAAQNAQGVPPNMTPTTTTTTTPAPATRPTSTPARQTQPKQPRQPRPTAAGPTAGAARIRAGMGFPKGNTGYGVHAPTGFANGAGGVH